MGGPSNKSIYLSIYLSVCLSVCLSVGLCVCLFVCLSVLSVCLSVGLSVCLFWSCVCVWVWVWTLLAQGMVPIIVCCDANSAACNSMQEVPEDWVKMAPTKTFTPSCDMKTGRHFHVPAGLVMITCFSSRLFQVKSVYAAVVSSYHCGPHPRGFSFEPHQFEFNLRTHNQTSVCSQNWL